MRTITIAVCPEFNDKIIMPPAGYLAGVNSMSPQKFKAHQRPIYAPTLDEGFYHIHIIDQSQGYDTSLYNKIARVDVLENPKVEVLADDFYDYASTPVRRLFYGVYGLPPGGWDEVSIQHPDGSWSNQAWLDTMRRYPESRWHFPLDAGGDLQAEPKKAPPPKSKMPPRP